MNTRSLPPARMVLAAAALIATSLAAHAAAQQSPQAVTPAPQNAVTSPSADIYDIRGPKPITSPWPTALAAATALLAMGGAYAAWARHRRRFREASKLPWDVALERLARARRLMDPPRGREFSIEVSGAVRAYIENRFDLLATHLTTDEFLHQFLEPAGSLLAAHRSQLVHFLQTCDLAKYGGWNLAASEMEAMLQSARRFIVASTSDVRSHDVQTVTTVSDDQSPTPASRETYVSLPST